MSNIDKSYSSLIKDIIDNGFKYLDPNRKDVYRYQLDRHTLTHDVDEGVPILTTKKIYFKGVVGELIWVLRGDTNIKYLVDNGINIWNKDAYNYYLKLFKKNFDSYGFKPLSLTDFIKFIKLGDINRNIPKYKLGDLGKVYGHQLRNFGGSFDQLKWIIDIMKNNPMYTKKTVTYINPNDRDSQSLTPCHTGFKILMQPIVCKSSKCNDCCKRYEFRLQWEQDSVDVGLGLPFNMVFYDLLGGILEHFTKCKYKGLVGDLSNVHIYEPHINGLKEQLERDDSKYNSTKLKPLKDLKMDMYNDIDSWLNSINISDFKLENYKSFPAISLEMLPYIK